jgi:hypothetical protein
MASHRKSVRLAAARHELSCRDCRVTWRSWFARLLGVGGMTPWVRPSRRANPESERWR